MRRVLLLVALTGCGGPMLEPGIYSVELTAIRSDIRGEPGQVSSVFWQITESDGTYGLEVIGGTGTVFPGRERVDDVVFWHNQAAYDGTFRVLAALYPSGGGFTGEAHEEFNLPSSGGIYVEKYAVAGDLNE